MVRNNQPQPSKRRTVRCRNQQKLTSLAYLLLERYVNLYFMLSNWGTCPPFASWDRDIQGPKHTCLYSRGTPTSVNVTPRLRDVTNLRTKGCSGQVEAVWFAGKACMDIRCHVDSLGETWLELWSGADLESGKEPAGFQLLRMPNGKQIHCSMIWAHCSRNTTRMKTI